MSRPTAARKEIDSLGEVDVPADKLWGAQTQRSLEHFSVGHDLIPREMITAYATLRKAAANANRAGGRLDAEARTTSSCVCCAGFASTTLRRASKASGCRAFSIFIFPPPPWAGVRATTTSLLTSRSRGTRPPSRGTSPPSQRSGTRDVLGY